MVGWATFCPTGDILTYGENLGGKNTWDMELFASVGTDTSNHTVADWNSPEFEITWREESGVGWCRSGNPMMTDWFEVAGDENLTIARSADLDITGHGFRWFSGGAESLNAADDFGGTTRVSAGTEEACFADGHPYTYDYGPGIGTGGCGVVRCGGMDGAGTRQLGPIYVRGDDITGDCWWSTTYVIYREE